MILQGNDRFLTGTFILLQKQINKSVFNIILDMLSINNHYH